MPLLLLCPTIVHIHAILQQQLTRQSTVFALYVFVFIMAHILNIIIYTYTVLYSKFLEVGRVFRKLASGAVHVCMNDKNLASL